MVSIWPVVGNTGERLFAFIVQVFRETELQVNIIVLAGGWF